MHTDYKVGDEVIYISPKHPMNGLVGKVTKISEGKLFKIKFNIVNGRGELRFASNIQYRIAGYGEIIMNSEICRLLYG